MPRAYDRYSSQRIQADHNPLAKLLDYQAATAESAQATGQAINNGISVGSAAAAAASSNNTGAFLTQLWLSLQSLYNGFTGEIDSGAQDFLAALQATASNASDAAAAWGRVFSDFGFDPEWVAAGENFVSWLQHAASGLFATNISASIITDGDAQLLLNPNFSGPISLNGNNIWVYDDTVYYVPPGQQVDDPGSAKITLTGVLEQLQSNPSVGTLPLGQPIFYAAQVLGLDVVGSGVLFEILAVPWIGNVAQELVSVATMGAPIGPTTGWTNAPSGSKGGVLAGSYTPAKGSGITSVSMLAVAHAAGTSGTAWISGTSEELTGGLIADLKGEFTAGQEASAAYWTSLGTAMTEVLGGNWAGGIADAETAWATYQAAEAGVASAAYVTLSQLLSSVGINIGDGMMSAGNVSSSKDLANLEADIASLLNVSTWEGWLSDDWTWFLGLFNTTPAAAGTASQDTVWNAIISDIVNPLNAIEAQANKVIVAGEKSLTDFFDNLLGIDNDPTTSQVQAASVSGTQGIQDISTTVQNTWDSIATAVAHYLGLDAVPGSDNSLSTVQDVLGQHAAQTSAALTQAGANTDSLVAITPSIPQPLLSTPQPNQVAATIPLFLVQNVQPITGTGVSNAPVVFHQFAQAAKVDSFTILATLAAAGAPTGFYINFYSVDPSTGLLTRIYASPNLVSQVTAYPGNANLKNSSYLNVALPSELSFDAGDAIAVDAVVVSSTTTGINLGFATQNAPPFPSSTYPTLVAAQRSPAVAQPSTVAWSSLTATSTTIWIGFNGSGDIYHFPVLRKVVANGSVVAPDWARFADVVPVGGGASGGGGIGYPGNPGGSTTVTSGSHSVTAAGAAGGSNLTSFSANDAIGIGAPTEAFNGDSFPGSTNVATKQPGSSPGGGGGGGNNNAGAYGYGGQCGHWNPVTWAINGGELFNITVGARGIPPAGQSVGAQPGAPGLAYIVFRAS